MLRFLPTIALLWLILFCCGFNGQHVGSGQLPPINRREEQALRLAKAKEILKYINQTADPCKDFYDFACGNWAKYHPAERSDELITTQTELELRLNKDLQSLLDEPVTPQEALSGRKIKDFYRSCLTVETTSQEQQNFLMNFVKTHGGLPSVPGTNWHTNFNWVQVVAQLRSNYGMDILLGLDIDTNLQTMRGNSIYLSEPKNTLIPVELCSAIATQEVGLRDEAYEVIQKTVAENMRLWFSLRDSEANRFAGDIVRFEFELCKKMRNDHTLQARDEMEDAVVVSQQRGMTGYRTGQNRLHGNRNIPQYPRQTLQQWTQQFGTTIDFKQFVDVSFDTAINDQVYMRSEPYYQHLARTIRLSSKPTIANYIMYRALSSLNLPTDNRSSKRHKFCVELATRYFPKVIGEMYSRKFQRGEFFNDVESIYNEIQKAFEQSLKIDWMDENARRAARQKLSQFKVRFPSYQNLDLSDLHLERLDYWRKLEMVMKFNAKQELNRLYSVDYNTQTDRAEATDIGMKLVPQESEITVGLALLQMPFYHYFYPNSLKFSLLGQQLARELVKAFDEQGWTHNTQSPMRWNDYTAEGFRNRSECFRTQFSNYMHNNPEVFKNASKLRILIADSSALNIAFNAYLAWLGTIDANHRVTLSKETLPDVNFTNTQLFFINFAQMRCTAKYQDQPTPDFLPMDRHTVERYDVNGPLGNSVEFAREFNCGSTTDMDPDDKCVIY